MMTSLFRWRELRGMKQKNGYIRVPLVACEGGKMTRYMDRKTRMGWLLMCLPLLAASCGVPTDRLTILHVNDTHSHIDLEKTGRYAGMGGIRQRAAYIDSVRKADGADHVLLLHAGDFCQGSAYFSQFGGSFIAKTLNALRYDVVTLGNHEFDNGLDSLAAMLAVCKMPVVCCNYDFSPFEAGKYIRPYAILHRGGYTVGVIGALCPLAGSVMASTAQRIPALDLVSTVQKYADVLRPQCDIVIALTHIGLGREGQSYMGDIQLCAATRNIDLFVGGHSHTFLESPVMQENLDGKPIPIVQTGIGGVYMGAFHLSR